MQNQNAQYWQVLRKGHDGRAGNVSGVVDGEMVIVQQRK